MGFRGENVLRENINEMGELETGANPIWDKGRKARRERPSSWESPPRERKEKLNSF
jgi:hypothetical protein